MIGRIFVKKQKKASTKENVFIPAPLGTQMRWWREKGVAEGTPGHFNEELYIKYQLTLCS